MKIIRQTATDMRQALRAVRERLGPDAVILSSRRCEVGVEVTAAIDFDAEQVQADVATPAAALTHATASAASPAHNAPAAPASAIPSQPSPWSEAAFAQAAPAAPGAATRPETRAAADNDTETNTDSLSQELKTLRRLLETQMAHLAWHDLMRRAPVHAEMLRELTEIGIAQDLAAQIVAQLPSNIELTPARRMAVALLAQRLSVTGDRWLDEGGCIALIGPTGVGKTTALAKLAVRWALRHGARDLALVAADSVRIGAQEQVQSLGQLLGAPVYRLDDLAGLPALLERLGERRFVLIDTPGSSPRDTQLAPRLGALAAAAPRVQTALVLAANTQAGTLQETVQRFAPAQPESCLLTKLDEAASLGGVLSILIRARLPISYVGDGQRVPEDLRPGRALDLVTSAVQLARTSGAAADEDLLRRRFGELAHAIA